MPAAQRNENWRPLESIGQSRDMAQLPGRRERDFRTRIDIADGTFLDYAIRDRTDPDKVGTVKGLQLLTLEAGTFGAYGDAYAFQYIDSLMNTIAFSFAENQNVTADVNLWCMASLKQPTPISAITVPDSDVLIWSHSSVTIDGTDYHNILSRVSVNINNNLQRQGMRQQYAAIGGTEPEISRGCYAILPTLEKLQISYGLHDKLPDDMMDTDDWGAVTLRAEQPGGGKYVQIVIDQNYLNSFSQEQAAANGLLTFGAQTASQAIAITTGTT
jgi:hypothetical protein